MIIQVSSGQGPRECELAVGLFLDYLRDNYIDINVLRYTRGYADTNYKSILISSEEDLSKYIGSVKIVFTSPYRHNHKRKNWFIDVAESHLATIEKFNEDEVKFEYLRSAGPGGQNVNKVESGVRAYYTPANISIVCTEERSQLENKRKAIKRLKDIIKESNEANKAKEKNDNWKRHTRIQRGNETITLKFNV